MDCSRAEQLLCAGLDGELDPGTAKALAAHLEGCLACRQDLTELQAVRDAFRRLSPERSRLRASDVLARVASGGQEPGEVRARPARPAGRLRQRVLWFPVAAALALAAVAWWRVESRAPVATSLEVSAPTTSADRGLPPSSAAPGTADCDPGSGQGCDLLACFAAADCAPAGDDPWPRIAGSPR